MKKIVILLFLSIACTVSAQKKVALLEPREGEGSSPVTGMEKAMVRGELRKSIVNHTGYEAFTRADIDQMMKEQDFQRTGNVSEEDIHRMGEMSGADFLCISTLTKSNTEFYLEAYLIDVETGKISSPASQYGELIGGKLANMLPVCQALAQELLGTYAPIVSQQAQAPAPQSPAPVSSSNIKTSQDVVILQTNGITSAFPLKTFADGSKGIVFWQDGERGLAVSLDVFVGKWENQSHARKCQDIAMLPNEDGARMCTPGMGAKNTSYMMSQLGMMSPVANWCVQHGEGWYLPSAGEMWYLLEVANLKAGPGGPVSLALQANGGAILTINWYWTSTENDRDEAINVSSAGRISSEDKTEALPVRAVRAF